MEKTWTVAGLLGEWQLTVRLEPDTESAYEVVGDAVQRFASLDPHFFDVVNLVEAESCHAGNSLRR